MRREWGETVFEEIMANNFPELRNYKSIDILKSWINDKQIHIQTHKKKNF